MWRSLDISDEASDEASEDAEDLAITNRDKRLKNRDGKHPKHGDMTPIFNALRKRYEHLDV